MTETFASITTRVQTQDPAITPEELEKLIAYHISERADDLFKEIMTGLEATLMRQAIRERFGLGCEIMPAMSIFVSISDEQGKGEVIPFSSLPFEEAIREIAEKDFSAASPEEILQLTGNVINDTCRDFLEAVILSNAELMRLLTRFIQKFGMYPTMIEGSPITIHAGTPIASSPPPDNRPGMYL